MNNWYRLSQTTVQEEEETSSEFDNLTIDNIKSTIIGLETGRLSIDRDFPKYGHGLSGEIIKLKQIIENMRVCGVERVGDLKYYDGGDFLYNWAINELEHFKNENGILVGYAENKKNIKEAAPFGTDPFGPGELTEKVRLDPHGQAGGDSYTGLLDPSTDTNTHHPNDYFSEGDHTPVTEKSLDKERQKKRDRQRKRKFRYRKADESSVENLPEKYDNISDDFLKSILDIMSEIIIDKIHSQEIDAAHTLKNVAMPLRYVQEILFVDNASTVGELMESSPRQYKHILEIMPVWENRVGQDIYDFDVRSFVESISQEAISSNWYRMGQWGTHGPKLPVWGQDNWVADTYKDILETKKNLERRERAEDRLERTKTPPRKKQMPNRKKKKISFGKDREEISIKDVLKDAAVTITTTSDTLMEFGSGFFIGEKVILTCAHVVLMDRIGDVSKVNVTIRYKDQERRGVILAYDPKVDVAAIIVDDANFKSDEYLRLSSPDDLEIGKNIISIGTPLGFENVVSYGKVSSEEHDYKDDDIDVKIFFVSATSAPGGSGGPVVFELDMSVAGITTAIIKDNEGISGLNAVTPISQILPWLDKNRINYKVI